MTAYLNRRKMLRITRGSFQNVRKEKVKLNINFLLKMIFQFQRSINGSMKEIFASKVIQKSIKLEHLILLINQKRLVVSDDEDANLYTDKLLFW